MSLEEIGERRVGYFSLMERKEAWFRMVKMDKGVLIVIIVFMAIGIVVASVVVYNLFLSPGCGPGETVPMEGYSVDEWGIFKQRYNSENLTYLTGPRPGEVVEPDVVEEVECKPVIYFHGNGYMELSVDIDLSALDVVTVPDAEYDGKTLSWDLEVAGDIYDEGDDAKVVTGPDEAYDYLFYEGRDEYPQNLMANVTRLYRNLPQADGPALSLNIRNIGGYGMEDIYVICELDGGGPKKVLHLSDLGPGEDISRVEYWGQWTNGSELRGMLKADLLERGLTDREAEDLLEYWVDGETDGNGMKVDKTLLETEGSRNVQILYFISEQEYDQKLPVLFSKAPDSEDRVGLAYVSGVPFWVQRS